MEKFKIFIPCLVLIGLTFIVVTLNNLADDDNISDTVTIITSDRFSTLMNDGGTHYDTKYVIDFNDKSVSYYESYYKGFIGPVYEDKRISNKILTKEEIRDVKMLILDIKKNKDDYGNDRYHTYMYYTLIDGDERVDIYDTSIITKIESLLS